MFHSLGIRQTKTPQLRWLCLEFSNVMLQDMTLLCCLSWPVNVCYLSLYMWRVYKCNFKMSNYFNEFNYTLASEY